MPSHKIHLTIASEVNKELKLDNDSIMLGSVLPDLTTLKDHGKSHYQVYGSYDEQLANPDKFVSEYKVKLNNPIMMGYLIHILTDRFYNDYFYRNHCVFDESGNVNKVKLKNGKIKSPIRNYKQRDFGKYDKYLLKTRQVTKFVSDDCIKNVEDLSVAIFDKEYLSNYILNANKEIDKPNLYKIKSSFFYNVLNKEELEELQNKCINYIIDYIKSIM